MSTITTRSQTLHRAGISDAHTATLPPSKAQATALQQALIHRYGQLLVPTGATAHVSHVEAFKVDGQTRLCGTLTIKAINFSAQLNVAAALTGHAQVTADCFPQLSSATCNATPEAIAAAADYAARIQRLSFASSRDQSLPSVVDPKTFDVSVALSPSSSSDLARITYSSVGWLGPNSTFKEFYFANGHIVGGKAKLTSVTYGGNRATNNAGIDLDAFV